MKRIKSKNSKDAELQECINSAYTDLHILLQGAFINISKLPNQLTIIEFTSLFENYDWNDIFDNLERLENETNLLNVETVYSTILENLKSNKNIKPLTVPRDSTYFKVWAGLMTDHDF
jgi:hypothetical protein